MLIMLFGIGLAILIFGIICYAKKSYKEKTPKFFKWVYDNEWFYYTLNIVGTIISIIALIAVIIVGVVYSNSMVIDDKIALYEEENANIQQSVNLLVEDYKDYESSTFKDFKADDMTMVLSMYPELKSNKLVVEQIELHVANNAKIKELKELKLSYRVYEWWLFF